MNKEQLLDAFIETGNSVERFRELLKEVAAATTLTNAETRDFQLFSIREINEGEGVIIFHVYDYEQSVKNEPPKLAKIKTGALIDLLGEKGYKEFLTKTRFLLWHNGVMYFPSQNALGGLAARAELSGYGVFDPAHELFALLARRFERDSQEATLVVRNAGKLKKLVACMSKRYAYVQQKLMCDIMDGFAEDMGSEPVCTGWEVSQFFTRVYFDFPEKADDFAKTYALPSNITPGICLYTSDTGDASFTATGFYNIGRNRIPFNIYRKKHSGLVDVKGIQNSIKHTVFDRYTKLPQRLCELINIPIDKPREVTEGILDQIGFIEEAGKRIGGKLVEVIISEYNSSIPYTAYDIAMSIMSIPGRFTDGAESTLRKIEAVVYKAAYADYARAIKEAESDFVLPPEIAA